MAHGAPERGLPPLVWHVSEGGGQVFLQVLVVLGATDHAEVVACGGSGTFGVVLSHALQTKEVGLLGRTRGKVRVPGGRTFMQNCVKRSRGLTYLV